MDRNQILREIIENSELNPLRLLISNSKKLQKTAFKGFRPQALTKKNIIRLLVRPSFINDDGLYEMFCDWWKDIHGELISELVEQKENNLEILIKRWSVPKVRLAIELSDLEGKEVLIAEFSEVALKEITNVRSQTAVASDAIQHELILLRSKIDKLERRLSAADKKNKLLSKQNKTLQASLVVERSRVKKDIESNKALTEKVRLLEKDKSELTLRIQLQKKEAISRLTELKVIQIDYVHLGDDPDERRRSLSLFYDLLCSLEGMFIEVNNRPLKWLEHENAKAFWKREGNKVFVLRRPVDYLIINTGLLMEDLLNVKNC